MDALRGRTLLASVFAVGVLVTAWALPVAAADCELSAPATVRVGAPQVIAGSGFPASATVDVELTIEGGNNDAFSVQSSPSGALEFSYTPEAIDVGKTTVVATAGSTCTAQVQFTVLGENEPAPTAQASEPGAEAGSTSGPGTVPATDSASTVSATSAVAPTLWFLAAVTLVIGLGGLIATRPARGR